MCVETEYEMTTGLGKEPEVTSLGSTLVLCTSSHAICKAVEKRSQAVRWMLSTSSNAHAIAVGERT